MWLELTAPWLLPVGNSHRQLVVTQGEHIVERLVLLACFWFVQYQGWTPDLTHARRAHSCWTSGLYTGNAKGLSFGRGRAQVSTPHHRHGQVLSDMTFFTSCW